MVSLVYRQPETVEACGEGSSPIDGFCLQNVVCVNESVGTRMAKKSHRKSCRGGRADPIRGEMAYCTETTGSSLKDRGWGRAQRVMKRAGTSCRGCPAFKDAVSGANTFMTTLLYKLLRPWYRTSEQSMQNMVVPR